MGVVRFGAPEEEINILSKIMSLSVFFEGGTYRGATALNASRAFDKVITVERSEMMFEIARSIIGNTRNIVMLKGDTRDYLQTVLESNDNIIFWLDAHWSGGDTYGENDECPLLKELEIIFSYKKNYAVLVDDARLFLAPPPKPHKLEHWPTIKIIAEIIPEGWELIIYDDVIYIFPTHVSQEFRQYVQGCVTKKWQDVSKQNIVKRFLSSIGINPC